MRHRGEVVAELYSLLLQDSAWNPMQLKQSKYRRHLQSGNGDTYSESEIIVSFVTVIP